jgi:penicillin G amidase
MYSKKRIFLGLAGTLFIVLIAGILFIRHLVIRSFPEYDTILYNAQTEEIMEIYRDDYGVPQIIAGTESDAYFAAGVVHAQDRLWQMEISRRAGEGRLAEILGPEALRYDKLFRTLNLQKAAIESASLIPPELLKLLESYCAGVNYIIHTQRGKYPVEFDMIQYEPEPWTVIHSLLIGRLMAWELNISWWADVTMGQLIEHVDFELATQAMPRYPSDAPVVIPRELINYRFANSLRHFRDADRAYRVFAGIDGSHTGSNSWVVGGPRSASGKPILANDPHLTLTVPSRWYELRLHATSTGLDVSGMTLPGSPVIVIGRNNAIAWGMTNVMVDDADFYIEQLDTTGAPLYMVDNQWRELNIRNEIISVKDSVDIEYTVYETHRGPLIQSILGIDMSGWIDQPISLRWTGFEPSTEFEAVYRINKSTGYDEFRHGLRFFNIPGQNFTYADTGGTIAFRTAVRVPIRPRGNPLLPFPGWDSSYDWDGYVPFEHLPELVNPPTDIIATANNKIVDDSYPYYLTSLWEPPSRIIRINELLNEQELLVAADFGRIQNDYVSPQARDVVPFLIHAFDHVQMDDPDLERALNYLRNWDFYMGPDDVPASIFNVFFVNLLKNTFIPRMGESLFREYCVIANIPIRVMSDLLKSQYSDWFDDPRTPSRESRDDRIRQSLLDAIEYLRTALGSDMRTWQWGRLHTITFTHLFGSHAPLDKVMNIGPFPIGGSNTTVNLGEYSLCEPYRNKLGPSMRFVVDMNNPQTAYTVIPTGQSGQPLHRHYKDQTQLWLDGRLKTHNMGIRADTYYSKLEIRPGK